MSSFKHYVPIFKWKAGEHWALKELKDSSKKFITPLIEIILPTVSAYRVEIRNGKKEKVKKTDEERLTEMVAKFREKRVGAIPKEIAEYWGKKKIFVDVALLYGSDSSVQLRIDSLTAIFTKAKELDLHLVPVLNLDDDSALRNAVIDMAKNQGIGLCLRVVSDLDKEEVLTKKLNGFLKISKLSESDIDLLIDIREVVEDAGKYLNVLNTTQKIPNLNDWRNLIIASGSFPTDLTECKFGEETYLKRYDWLNWRKFSTQSTLKRKPLFSDYTIRNPIYNESLQDYIPSASIKYTLEDTWMIMRGRKNKPEMYLASAKLLVDSSKKFYGVEFSSGDKFIGEKAKHHEKHSQNPSIGGTGNSKNWIGAGINHHLEVVADQISSLS